MVRHVAWGYRGHAAITSIGERTGKLALYRVTDGPTLQPLHELDTGRMLEDLSFSPCGAFVSALDQGSRFSVAPTSRWWFTCPHCTPAASAAASTATCTT